MNRSPENSIAKKQSFFHDEYGFDRFYVATRSDHFLVIG